MKTLKFKPHLAEQIIRGEKTSTWRLFDDKDIQVGDWVVFENKETTEIFGHAKIISVTKKFFKDITKDDWVGHESYKDENEMYQTYRRYYGDKVNEDTEVKIIGFDFKK